MEKYYVYEHTRDDNNEVFYVGIGTSQEATTELGRYRRAYQNYRRNKFWKNVVNKTTYTIQIVYQTDLLELCKLKEIELVKKYGRRDLDQGTLTNLTDGGDGQNRNKAWNSKSVHQYSLDGQYLQSYESQKSAAQLTGCKNISYASLGVIKTACNCQWSTVKVEALSPIVAREHKNRRKVIQQLSLDDEVVAEYLSLIAASKAICGTNAYCSSISMCCNNKRTTAFNYKWKFKNEINIICGA